MDEATAGKIVVGWREPVALPDWGIKRVRAKIDTGARTSAIHVDHIEDLEDGRLRFEVVVRERPERRSVWVESEVARRSRVRPSTGIRQTRPVVVTTLRLGGHDREIEVSLVTRRGMLCRMLVGRTALAGWGVVDPAATHLTDPRRPTQDGNQAP